MSENRPAIVKQQQPGMIMPAGTVEQALEAFRQYQTLKDRLGTKDDFQKIGDKNHPKKSFVRKVQRFFNVSCKIIQDEPLTDPKTGKIIAWLAKARATHLGTGAYQEADGSCGMEEKAPKQRTIHNIRAHAITRAKNRAILDLVGFGEVSAEEINEQEWSQPQQQPQQQPQPTQRPQGLATVKQKKAIYAKAKNKGLTDDQIKKLARYHLQRDTNNMTVKEASELIKLIDEMDRSELVQLIGEQAIEAELVEVEVVDKNAPITDDEIKGAMSGGN